jgi:hypothetical protein
MGSKTFKAAELPPQVVEKIGEATARKMMVIVGEVPSACKLYQDHLKSKSYGSVIAGHAKSMRYNAGRWKTIRYGDDVHERETNMIEDCDSTIIIWADNSGVIIENLQLLKRLRKPTFVYEYSTKTNAAKADWLDQSASMIPTANGRNTLGNRSNARSDDCSNSQLPRTLLLTA